MDISGGSRSKVKVTSELLIAAPPPCNLASAFRAYWPEGSVSGSCPTQTLRWEVRGREPLVSPHTKVTWVTVAPVAETLTSTPKSLVKTPCVGRLIPKDTREAVSEDGAPCQLQPKRSPKRPNNNPHRSHFNILPSLSF